LYRLEALHAGAEAIPACERPATGGFMSGKKVRYLGIALSLAVFIGLAPEAGAAEMRNRVPARQVGALEWTWGWIAGWFGGEGHGGSQGLSRLWAEASCGLDPNGAPATAACGGATVSNDASCGIDPDGRCTSVKGDVGLGLDPNGDH
jgi:hypothetical protein